MYLHNVNRKDTHVKKADLRDKGSNVFRWDWKGIVWFVYKHFILIDMPGWINYNMHIAESVVG